MPSKSYKPIIVYCTRGNEHSSMRFAFVKEAEEWINLAKKIGLIDDAEVVLDSNNA